MAAYRYFAEIGGETVQFDKVSYREVAGRRRLSPFGYHAATQAWVKCRRIEYRAFGSKHECDARCLNAKGKHMSCECVCGGKNHGKGQFIAEAA